VDLSLHFETRHAPTARIDFAGVRDPALAPARLGIHRAGMSPGVGPGLEEEQMPQNWTLEIFSDYI
jgi:hypothetical protein